MMKITHPFSIPLSEPSAVTDRRKIVLSVLLGLTGFTGSFFSPIFVIPPHSISITWYHIFPLLAAIGYGPRYGIMTGVIGLAAFAPFLAWPTNGWANIVPVIFNILFYVGHGYCAEARRREYALWNNPFIAQILFAIAYGAATFFLYPVLFSFNPPLWSPLAVSHMPEKVLIGIIIKSTAAMFGCVLAAVFIFMAPGTRRLLGISTPKCARFNGRIFLSSIVCMAGVWFLWQMLNSIFVRADFPQGMLHVSASHEIITLFLIVVTFLVGGIVIALFMEKRNLAQAALRESEEKYRELVENANSIILRMDTTGTVTFFNEYASRFFGFSHEEIIGRNVIGTIVPLTDSLGKDLAQMVLNIGVHPEQYKNNENENICKNGTRVWVAWANKPIMDDQGRYVELLCIGNDITERKLAEKELFRHQDLLNTIIESTSEAIFAKEITGKYHSINEAGARMLGYRVADVIGHTDMELLPAETAREFQKTDEYVMSTGQAYEREEMGVIDGKTCIFLAHKAPWRDYSGKVIGVIGVSNDITKRKLAEEERVVNVQRMHVLMQLNQMTEATVQEVTDFALEEAVRLTQSKIGYLAFLNDDESVLTMHSWSKSAMAECAIADKPIKYPVENTGLWGEAVRQRRSVITNDYTATGPMMKGYPEGHVTVIRHMNTPVFVGSRIVLVAGVGNKTEEYNQDDVQQLTLIMEGMWRLIERKQAEEELLREQLLIKTLLDSLPGIFYLYSYPALRLVRWNKNHETLLGFGPGEIKDRPVLEWFIPEAKEVVLEAVEVVMEKGQNLIESPLLTKDGCLIPFILTGVKFEVPGQSYFMGVGIDISERKRAEEALRESEIKFRLIAENTADLISILDMNMRFIYVSPASMRLRGFTVEEAMAQTLEQVLTPESMRLALTVFEKEMILEASGTADPDRTRILELEEYKKDGTTVWVEISLSFMRDKDGKPVEILIVTRDITERKQAEEAKAKLEVQLQQAQKFEAIGTLAGGIAHDFNNLLMGIQGRASLLSLDLKTSNSHWEHINAIEEYVQSATSLTRQLLGFARGGKYEVKPVDLNDLVLNSSAMFGRTKKEIQIHTKCQTSALVVEADRGQIEQVLLNMYVNAWQAMHNDEGHLYLETKIVTLDEANCKPHQVKPGRYVKISITDTGAGMDEATRLRIFDPFFTTKEKGRGTGLGLASAYGIIKNHGGMITVYSEVGRGTTFNIYLPLSDKEAHRHIPRDESLIKGSATILLVDDEELIIDVAQAMLERLGYRVVICRGGQEAISVITDIGNIIDMVIIDMIMPGMDGGATFDRIREIYPRMPVLLSSGYAINGHADKIMRRGCNGFIQKPYNISELSQKIRIILDDAKMSSSQ